MIILGAALSFVLFVSFAQAQVVVDPDNATLSWVWDDTVPVDGFRMKCGPTPGKYTFITDILNPKTRTVALRSIGYISGGFFCAISGFNKFDESGASNEVNFTTSLPAPTGLKVQLGLGSPSGTSTITVSWVAPTVPKPTVTDWIGLWLAGSTNHQYIGTKTCGGKLCWENTKGAATGNFIVTPPGKGTYNVRYCANAGFICALKTGVDIVVP